MRKYDESLVEVWEWRKKVHDELKELTVEEYIKNIREKADNALAKYGIELKRVDSKNILQKIK